MGERFRVTVDFSERGWEDFQELKKRVEEPSDTQFIRKALLLFSVVQKSMKNKDSTEDIKQKIEELNLFGTAH